jgi:predicted transporter
MKHFDPTSFCTHCIGTGAHKKNVWSHEKKKCLIIKTPCKVCMGLGIRFMETQNDQ